MGAGRRRRMIRGPPAGMFERLFREPRRAEEQPAASAQPDSTGAPAPASAGQVAAVAVTATLPPAADNLTGALARRPPIVPTTTLTVGDLEMDLLARTVTRAGKRIELLAPTGPDTPVGKFLAKRGPGMHHIAYELRDASHLHDACDLFGQKQIPIIHPVVDYSYKFGNPVFGGELGYRFNLTSLSRSNASFDPISSAAVQNSSCAPSSADPAVKIPANCLLRGIPGSYTRFSAETTWKRSVTDPIGQVWTPFASLRADAINEDLSRFRIEREIADLQDVSQ